MMKESDSKNQKKKKFLKIPTLPGGKAEFLKIVSENLIYPEEALKHEVEGVVYLTYNVNNIGEVMDISIEKGIGYGCDEEAVRLINLLAYEPPRNRGVRMKVQMKSRILFKLPIKNNPQSATPIVTYITTIANKKENPEPKPRTTYNYTIKLGE